MAVRYASNRFTGHLNPQRFNRITHGKVTLRTYCTSCERPLSRCVCGLATQVNLPWRLVVLQDPGEVKQAKGSLALLRACVPDITVWSSHDFSQYTALNALLAEPNLQCVLLYPGEQAQSVSHWQESSPTGPLCIIVLDGTWRKSLKMLLGHPQLAQLPRMSLASTHASRYLIRKSPRTDGLSTFEAVGFLMREWCQQQGDAVGITESERLLASFERWIARELAALPPEIRARYPTT